MSNEKAMKFDDGKPPIDLIDQEIILELAKVLGYGAKKYKAHNWKIGLPISRYYSACLRHLLAFNSGETFDSDSGLNHLGHAACNLMFMLYMLKHKPELDDRPEVQNKKPQVGFTSQDMIDAFTYVIESNKNFFKKED